MSSNDQSGLDQSPSSPPPAPPPPPPPSSVPDTENHIERIIHNRGLRTFLVVDHTANLRKGTKVSAIWYLGGEREYLPLATLRPLSLRSSILSTGRRQLMKRMTL